MASTAVEMQQNVVVRVANLRLLSTAYDMVTSVYSSTKENHPYLKSVCEAAEKGVTVITAVAVTSAMPILQKLEPQIAFANGCACKGLDRIEKKLPFLHQATDKVVANAKDVVTTKVSGAKDVVTHTVTGAKETVAKKITGVVDKTKETVHESMEMTKAVVTGSVNHVLESRMAKMLSSGVNSALTSSEALVDHYLPLTEDEQAKEAKRIDGFEAGPLKASYYMRLGLLSTKVHQRAYQQALAKVRSAKQRSQEAIFQLRHTVDLVEYARENMGTANQKIQIAQDKLYQTWVEWRKSHVAEQIESHTLANAQNLGQQLQTTCLVLVSSIQGLPRNIQEQVHYISVSAREMYSTFKFKTSFKELPGQILTTSKDQLTKMKDSLDGVMDYLVNNTPLNWLVGPFYPQLTGSQHSETQEGANETTEEKQSEQLHNLHDA
ncbi:perilipin-2-like [Heptranchias perlo]|uniref:perilipin-2-like n=1 Tax=Heptranchias perlo TaxID=212740 RepID=UPI00355A12C6